MTRDESDRDDLDGFVWDRLMRVEEKFKGGVQEPERYFKPIESEQ